MPRVAQLECGASSAGPSLGSRPHSKLLSAHWRPKLYSKGDMTSGLDLNSTETLLVLHVTSIMLEKGSGFKLYF
jgi:hypothetical protein